MKIIAITNRKGGTAKTVTAAALGTGLSLRGYKVLFVDLDSQSNLSFDIGAEISRKTIMEVLGGMIPASEAIQHAKGGDIIPAGPRLALADTVFTDTGREYILREALQPIGGRYDFCIVDTAPALGVLVTAALTAADTVIIPTGADIHALQGIYLLWDTLQTVKRYTNKDMTVSGILITRYNGRTVLSKDMKANIEEAGAALGVRVFKTPIREGVAVREAQAMRTNILTYAPRSKPGMDYAAFIDEFMEG